MAGDRNGLLPALQPLPSLPAKERNQATSQPRIARRCFGLFDRCRLFDIEKFYIFYNNVIRSIPLVLAAEGGGFDPLTLVRPRTPRPTLPTIDPLVVAPPFLDAQGVGTPVPPPISEVAVHPGRIEVKARFPPSGGLRVQDRRQGDVANIAADADVKMTVPVFRVHDHLDDRVLVKMLPDEGGDVPFGPGLQRGVVARAKMNDEVREVPSLVEAATVRRRDFAAVVVAVDFAERIDPMPVNPGAVFSVGVLGPTGAGRLMIFQADEIVWFVTYNTHGSFVARQE